MEQGRTVGAVVAHALEHGYNHVEVSQEAEDEWVESILAAPPRVGMAGCTPGYCKTAVALLSRGLSRLPSRSLGTYRYSLADNNEGKAIDQEIARYSGGYPKGPLAFFKYIQEWRSDGKFEGIDFKTVG